jgi:hypothetical protein
VLNEIEAKQVMTTQIITSLSNLPVAVFNVGVESMDAHH